MDFKDGIPFEFDRICSEKMIPVLHPYNFGWAGFLTIVKPKGYQLSEISPDPYWVVIEGQSSKIAFNIDDWENNYTLSYLRAQFLNEFWKAHGIDFASLPKCELIISGSGEGGVPRVVPIKKELDAASNGDQNMYWQLYLNEEKKNQRFLIHIVPVIGNIEITKAMIDEIKGKRPETP